MFISSRILMTSLLSLLLYFSSTKDCSFIQSPPCFSNSSHHIIYLKNILHKYDTFLYLVHKNVLLICHGCHQSHFGLCRTHSTMLHYYLFLSRKSFSLICVVIIHLIARLYRLYNTLIKQSLHIK